MTHLIASPFSFPIKKIHIYNDRKKKERNKKKNAKQK